MLQLHRCCHRPLTTTTTTTAAAATRHRRPLAARQQRGVVEVFSKGAKSTRSKYDRHNQAAAAELPSGLSRGDAGFNPAIVYKQEGKLADFFLKADMHALFQATPDTSQLSPLAVSPTPLPAGVVSEMWRYTDWAATLRGRLEQKEEEGRRTEFVQFLFERLGERYKFLTRRNVAMRSRHAWGQASATLSYPRGHFCVVHFVTDFNKWNTTETIGQYPGLWPKPEKMIYLYLDMAAHENYRIGVGPPRWGVVTDGRSWRIVEQVPTETGAWDGRQAFRESSVFHVPTPLTEEAYGQLVSWLNHIFVNHAPVGAEDVPKWRAAREERNEAPDAERQEKIRQALAGLGDI